MYFMNLYAYIDEGFMNASLVTLGLCFGMDSGIGHSSCNALSIA